MPGYPKVMAGLSSGIVFEGRERHVGYGSHADGAEGGIGGVFDGR